MGVPQVPEAKAGPSQVQSWGPRAGSRREGLYLEHRPRELELSGFQAAAGCSTFRGHRSLEGWQAWPHSTVLCKHHFPRPEPWLTPGVGLSQKSPPTPAPHPPAVSVPLSFSSPFLPFLPQGHNRKFPLPSEGWQGPRSPAVRAPSLHALWAVCWRQHCRCGLGAPVLCQQALLLLQTLGLMFLSRNQFPLLVF